MAKLYDLKELMEATGLSERTLRYYLAEVVDAPSGTPGRKAYYPQEVLDRLQVARRVLQGDYDPKRGEVKPSLRAFREWLATLSPDEVREMAEMPYRIKPKQLVSYEASLSRASGRRQRRSAEGAVSRDGGEPGRGPGARGRENHDAAPAAMHRIEPLDLGADLEAGLRASMRGKEIAAHRVERPSMSIDPNHDEYAPMGEEDKAAENESAADYLARVAGPKTPPKPEPGPWRRYRFGDELEIKTRRRLTEAQERQLRLAGKLLQAMLEEG